MKLPKELQVLLLFYCLSSFIIQSSSKPASSGENDDYINISSYPYPSPTDTDYFRVAIFATNDLHGKVFPKTFLNEETKEEYESGGAEFLAGYLNILREDWKDRFLWLDAGDQFQGGMEFFLSNGTIMNDVFNTKKVDAAGLGNHEFDFGIEELKKKMAQSKYPYLSANLYNKKEGKYEFLPNLLRSKLFTVDKVKIGVIGLSTKETLDKSGATLTDIEFHDYAKIVIEEGQKLRLKGANAVILLSHFGLRCKGEASILRNLQIYERFTIQEPCDSDSELMKLLNSLEKGVINAVVAGHAHQINHHFENDIPVVQSPNSAVFANVIYLTFDPKNEYYLVANEIVIEGPLPLCSKVFQKTRRCDYVPKEDLPKVGLLKEFTFHKKLFKRDEELNGVLAHWREELKKKETAIAYNEALLTIKENEETTLANIITDACRKVTEADLSFYNTGAFRTNWYPGKISEVDLYNMFPFPGYLTTFEMTGREMIRMLSLIQSEKVISPTSGVFQTFNVFKGRYNLISVKLFNGVKEKAIDPSATYVICTSNYLADGKSIFKKVSEWYKLRNQKKYGEIINYVIDYVKSIQLIKASMFIDKNHPRIRIINNLT